MESNLVVAFMRDFVRVWQRDASIVKRLRVFFPVRALLAAQCASHADAPIAWRDAR